MRIGRGATDLALQLTIASGIDVGEGRADGYERLRVSDTARGSKNAQELVALAPDAAEEAPLLENDGPGNNREQEKKQKDAAGDPTSLRKDISNIGDKNRGEQKNDVPLSESK
jgi:hypothetical protein